jgi:hypothetical protein
MGPARTACVQQIPTYSSTTTHKRIHSQTPSGRSIARSVLVAVVDCKRNDGVLIGGTCNTFVKSGTEDDIGVEPLSMVAIVPFDARQPSTTGFVECRARIPEGLEPEDLDWDIEAVAECCLDDGEPDVGGGDFGDGERRGGGPRGPGGRGGSSDGSWSNQSPRSGAQPPGAPSLTVIHNPPVSVSPPSLKPMLPPTPAPLPPTSPTATLPTDGLDPGEEEMIEFDPGADGNGGAWGALPGPGQFSGSNPAGGGAPQTPSSNWDQQGQQGAAMPGWQGGSVKPGWQPGPQMGQGQAGATPFPAGQWGAGAAAGAVAAGGDAAAGQEEEEGMFEEEGQTASVVAKPQGSVTGWQKQPQQQQQQQSGTAMTKPAPSAQPKQGPTDGAPGETHCSINYVVSCHRLAHAESSEGWLTHS